MLLLLLNTAMLTGHSSTESVMSFPKNDIRDLKATSDQQAKLLAHNINHDVNLTTNISRLASFNTSYDRFIEDMNTTYMSRGAIIGITYNVTAPVSTIDYAVINVTYDNGNTIFKESWWAFFT